LAAAAAQHELGTLGFPSDSIHRSGAYSNALTITLYVAKALLRAKRKKRLRDDDSSTEGTVSLPQTAKKKERRTDLHTPAESDTESESDLVTAKSPTLTPSSDAVHSKSTNVRKVKEKVKPSTSKQKPVPKSFYKTEYMKPLKGMDLSFPQGANVFSAVRGV
jgi:hypothetical protein